MNLIVKVTPTDESTRLSDLLSAPLGLDIWEVKPDHLVMRAGDAQVDRLQKMGYAVQEVQSTESFLSAFATDEAFTGYHTAQSLEQDLRRLAESAPGIAELHEIGRSVENRPIWALRIGERRNNTRKLLFMGCHHAREWIAVEVPYYLADYLVANAGSQPVAGWLSRAELWVAPMVNPDGHEYTRGGPAQRLWRKNRRPNRDGSVGVDPNRNYGYMWGTLNVPTSSKVPSDETYVGPRAFSEPETRAVRDLVGRELFSGIITYHSYSQLILYPWGYTNEPIPDRPDRDLMTMLARDMAQQIRDVHGKVYTPEQASQLYPTAGDTTDYTYGIYGIPSFTVELRPTNVAGGGFILPPAQIQPTWEENRPAALAFIQRILGP